MNIFRRICSAAPARPSLDSRSVQLCQLHHDSAVRHAELRAGIRNIHGLLRIQRGGTRLRLLVEWLK